MVRKTYATLVLAIAVGGCGDDPAAPTMGAIRVSVSTTGSGVDRDPNGYSVNIDAGVTRAISWNESFVATDIAPGNHSVHLDGLADNCSVTGSNPVTISVNATRDTADAQSVSFVVSCVPNLGSFRASVVTSGQDLDTDGYSLMIDGIGPRNLASNGEQVFSGLRAGQYHLTLSGVSNNCIVVGSAERLVVVQFNATAESSFAVNCVTSGTLVVTTAATGEDIDQNQYRVQAQRLGSNVLSEISVNPNSSGRVSSLLPGEYQIRLYGIGPNCSSTSNPTSVTVTGGSETQVVFNIVCTAFAALSFTNEFGSGIAIFRAKINGTDPTRLTSGSDASPAWSPDGTRIAFSSFRDGNWEIYVMHADGQNQQRLTQSGGEVDRAPAWSPDGTRIAFSSERDGNSDIYVMNADGTNKVRLTEHAAIDADPAWSPDGNRIAFTSHRESFPAIWVMNADGTGATRLTSNNLGDSQPTWSPDGKRIAFAARTTSNRYAVYLMNADGSDRARFAEDYDMVADPAWSPDGRQIAFTGANFNCGWYYYYCYTAIEIASVSGSRYEFPIIGAREPAWRSR